MANLSKTVAIIGAGIAGLSCGRRLIDLGYAPTLFDKGRRVGGRCATRRVRLDDGGTLTFDHGAQFATARGAAFAAALNDARAEPWREGRLVPTPTMRSLPEAMSIGLDIRQGIEIRSVARVADEWRLTDTLGALHGPYEALICTAPAPQSARLFPDVSDVLSDVEMAPCWALMMAFRSTWSPGFDLREDDDVIGLAAREGGKPSRDPATDRWIVHATPAWTRENLERSADEARELLLNALSRLSSEPLPPLSYGAAHRWRFARVEAALGAPFLETGSGAVLAGDWCLGARLEAAFESGRAAAELVASKA